ncbi:glycerol-3-phosphate dehydrogenase [Mycolicibacterium chubuense]|uniref:Glycerol-3-phosphate dehydrogenase n=1 Tax=Mycolicibacterium chubuense TaxID=1800 RepID=A0A0J6YJD7_MYCCU|nr:glycerol-3-phosphate dehydrogenase/oxidase [Mycolicibacterium chubuense]KMO72966.1 Aerobic glycerol-3-phosphate dehydrogenase [Mycolicibacterium chubuense]ORA56470.1 glycerol-3-phosphate dehydrogenase [Mycolicibacterium chubuense]SPX99110.1 glycerol-3-phosphate dehydrogenase [Mycolicibacterium chubuense]
MQSLPLSPRNRDAALTDMADEPLDILIIGGGVVGAGAALDAATRGLRTGLVEARDLASGTSSRSSKLIHGGLRYLEMLDFGLVAEALSERGLMLEKLAPHLVRPVKFLYPLKHRGWERLYLGAGLALYDAMSKASGHGAGVPLHRHLTRRGALRAAPSLSKDSLVGALQYYDAQVDDARHTMTIARTAAAYGARVATRTRVVDLIREGERVTGARVVDLESGREHTLRARQVINATGVWTDDTQTLANERGQFHVRSSKGIHLVVPRDRIRSSTGIILRTETSVLFVIPWGRHWIIGTTDTDWSLDKAHPAASQKDIRYLLDQVNAVLRTPLTEADVEGVFAGLRPLLAGESADTSALSREHAVAHSVPGLVVIAGGKYTTYRVMAKDAVDEAVHGLGETFDRRIPGCITDDVPLLGAEGYRAMWNARTQLAAESGLNESRIAALLNRYGSMIGEILALIREDPSLGAPLAAADDYLRAEVVYGTTHEGALHLDDILCRRTRISIETFDRGTESCSEVADLMAPVLGWSDEQKDREIAHYLARVAAERESQAMPDDETADGARLGAADIVPVS